MMFLRSFSHELRHPIVSITGISNLTIKQLEYNNLNPNQIDQVHQLQNQKVNDNLKIIEQESQQLLNISNQIIDITDIQSHNFELQPTEFDIDDLIRGCFDSIRSSAESKKISLITDISKTIPQVIIADKKRIQTLLMILLRNSLKYTKKGFIQVQVQLNRLLLRSTSKTFRMQSSISYNDSVFLCQFTVKDSGIGMSDQIKHSLFHLFGRIKEEENSLERPVGIGLGLYTAQLLAAKLGDRPIEVESLPDKGSSFTFYSFYNPQDRICRSYDNIIQDKVHIYKRQSSDKGINYHYSAKPIKPIQSQKSTFNIRKIKKASSQLSLHSSQLSLPCECSQILLVDDTDIIRQILTELLHQFRIEEAFDGLEALNIIQTKSSSECCQVFQLIIMDYQMPIMDGCDATRRIRACGYDAPILGYTAYNNSQDIQMCLVAGMDHVLNKPAKAEEIQKMVDTLRNTNTKRRQNLFEKSSFQIKSSSHEMSHKFSRQVQDNEFVVNFNPLKYELKSQLQDYNFKKCAEKLCKKI